MVTKQRAREERGRGVPLDDVERIARHYHVSIEDACELLTIYSVSDLLPERGSGLPTNVSLVGHTANELRYGLDKMELYEGGGLEVAIVSREIPDEEDLGAFYVRATAAGYRISYPDMDIVDGLPVMSFKVRREPTPPGTTGFAWAALIPLIPTALIAGLVAFGITRIGDISKALVPLLLISFGGMVVLAAILTRRPVMEAAGRYAERRLPKTKLKYLAETKPREWEFPKESYPPPEKVGPEHLPRLARVDPKKFCCRQCGECAPRELLAEGRFLDRISWLRHHYQEKHPGMWGQVMASTERKRTREMVEVLAWAERDRLHIEIRDKVDNETIAEWWDENARQMFEDGFFKGGVPTRSWEKPSRELVDSVLDYAESVGILIPETGWAYRIGEGYEVPQEYLHLLEPESFPKRKKAIEGLDGPVAILEVHSDGDLTIEDRRGAKFVVTTEGDVFLHHTAKEALQKILGDQYLTVTDPGKSAFKKGEVVSLWAFYQENERLRKSGEAQASGTYEIKGKKPGEGNGHRNLLEFLGDSPEFLAYTIDLTGMRQKLDETFQTAIQRARS